MRGFVREGKGKGRMGDVANGIGGHDHLLTLYAML